MKNKVMVSLLMLAGLIVPAQAQYIDFSEDNWDLSGAVVTEHLGRTSLEGVAGLKDVDFTDGIIEVDIAANGKTSYPGVIFRVQSLDNCERFYIRPHRAGNYVR